MAKELYDIFNEGDIITDTDAWGNKRFTVRRFLGKLKNLPELICESSSPLYKGRRITICMSPEYLERINAATRPLAKIPSSTLTKMVSKGHREARREMIMRWNSNPRNKFKIRIKPKQYV